MNRYALYLESDLNRVFTGSLLSIASTELRLVLTGLGAEPTGDIDQVSDGRSQLLRFSVDAAAESVAAVVGQLSASAALFRIGDSDSGLVQPIPISDNLTYPSELVTTQRYRGKTNERLTRAMLNMALASAGVNPCEPRGTLLDPMCGRGTTLNWAVAYGMNAVGIEPDRASLDHYASFLETWAKRQRLPHKMHKFKPNDGRKRHREFKVSPDRATQKAERGQTVVTFNADGADKSLHIKNGSIDVIVSDLPYGVQHQDSERESDTSELLERLLPVWHQWVRPGGSICLAWNLKRAGRRDVSRVLAMADFTPITVTGGHTMRHRVDATIDRDVIVAIRT